MPSRFIQTTIVNEVSEHAISAIFLPKVEAGDLPASLRTSFGVQNVIRLPSEQNVSPAVRKRGLDLHGADAPFAYITAPWFVSAFFDGDNTVDSGFIETVLYEESIIMESSPPMLTSLSSMLNHASGVAIGAYVGVQTATAMGNPLLMFMTVPIGMLIIGSAAGVGMALEHGLRDMILKVLNVQPAIRLGGPSESHYVHAIQAPKPRVKARRGKTPKPRVARHVDQPTETE
jgi:hypothetical protein